MGRIQACLAIAGIAVFLMPPLQAQPTRTNVAKFTSSTELVLIPTGVNDKSGVHISRLQSEEFALEQYGKSHPLAVFEEIKTDAAPVPLAAGVLGSFSY